MHRDNENLIGRQFLEFDTVSPRNYWTIFLGHRFETSIWHGASSSFYLIWFLLHWYVLRCGSLRTENSFLFILI